MFINIDTISKKAVQDDLLHFNRNLDTPLLNKAIRYILHRSSIKRYVKISPTSIQSTFFTFLSVVIGNYRNVKRKLIATAYTQAL